METNPDSGGARRLSLSFIEAHYKLFLLSIKLADSEKM